MFERAVHDPFWILMAGIKYNKNVNVIKYVM